MKAALKKGAAVRLATVNLPPLEPHEVRIKVEACGICGTDLHLRAGSEEKEGPFGHEIAGTVAELGAHVRGLQTGQKVALESSSACGRCENCRNMRQEFCTGILSFWGSPALGFAEEMLSPAQCAVPYADSRPEVAALSEPLGVAIDLLRLAEVRPDSNVLVTGAGCIGLMAVALAKRHGARRIVVAQRGRRPARIAAAKRFGADEVFDPEVTPYKEALGPWRPDRLLATTPPTTLPAAFEVAAKGALIVFIGIAYDDGAFCRFEANRFHFQKLQLRASFAAPAMFTPLALQYLRERVVDGEALLSHRYPLDRIAEAMETARNNPEAVKVVVLP
jgi:threonine dehydrogenase-like Zn-dependent dehydrogenase